MWHTRRVPLRGWRAWTILALAVLGVMAGAQTASAQISDDLGVIGQLQYQDANGNKVFVEGVDLSIDDVGGATTDKEAASAFPWKHPVNTRSTLIPPRCPPESPCAIQTALRCK